RARTRRARRWRTPRPRGSRHRRRGGWRARCTHAPGQPTVLNVRSGSYESGVPSVDVVDETFVVVPPDVLAAEFATPARWRALWPDLDLEVMTDRGAAGLPRRVTGALGGRLAGGVGVLCATPT